MSGAWLQVNVVLRRAGGANSASPNPSAGFKGHFEVEREGETERNKMDARDKTVTREFNILRNIFLVTALCVHCGQWSVGQLVVSSGQ